MGRGGSHFPIKKSCFPFIINFPFRFCFFFCYKKTCCLFINLEPKLALESVSTVGLLNPLAICSLFSLCRIGFYLVACAYLFKILHCCFNLCLILFRSGVLACLVAKPVAAKLFSFLNRLLLVR